MSEPIENTGNPLENVPEVPAESLSTDMEVQPTPEQTLNETNNANQSVTTMEKETSNDNPESDHDSETENLYNDGADAAKEEKNENIPESNEITKEIDEETENANKDSNNGATADNDEDNDDDDDDDDDDEDSESSESEESSSDESETSKVENEEEEKTGTNQEPESAESKEVSTAETSTSEKTDTSLLERQMEYMKESRLLDDENFKQLPDQGKAFTILKLLSTNPATKIPNSDSILNISSISIPQAPTGTGPMQSNFQPQRDNVPLGRTDLNEPMNAKERELYNIYLEGENKITEMHNIPPKSRLFIGNLPLKNVTKEDLFRIFHPYGHILQINIKNAFGFIQYDNHQSVVDAIKVESEQINFGKKLILEVSSSNARPQFDHGDHGANNSSTFISTSKRPFDNDEYGSTDNYRENASNSKRTKRRVPECLIFVRRTADRSYATEIFNSIKNGTGLETDMMFLKPRMELWKLVNDAAFDGTWGVILVNKTHDVDIQTFYKGPQGETKFDEYVGVSAQDAVGIFNNLKTSRKNGSRMQGPINSSSFGYEQPPMGMPPAQQQQGYYGNYNMPPPQQGYGMPPPPQNYGMPPPQQGYGIPPPPQMGQGYGRYQNNQNYNNYQNMPPPPQNHPLPMQQNNQLSALLGANPGQMDQQQLLGALQNLPPNVIANLLATAQQQQQQQPNQQQQLLGLLQSAQQQQQQPSRYSQNTGIQNQQMGTNDYNQDRHSNMNSRQDNPHQQPPQDPNAGGNNVQNLLDSLAKLQK